MNQGITGFLNELIQIEFGAIRGYEQAIAGARSVELRAQFTGFVGEHHRHVQRLSALVLAYGGQPIQERPLVGYLVVIMPGIAATGDTTALIAMRVNEELTNRTYDAAVRQELPADVRAALLESLADERKHITWILSSGPSVAS